MLVGLAGLIGLSLYRIETPASLVAIVSGCIGSLSSFLVSVPRGSAGSDSSLPAAGRPGDVRPLSRSGEITP